MSTPIQSMVEQIPRTPLHSGSGASFRTHELLRQAGKLVFIPTSFARGAYLILLTLGYIAAVGGGLSIFIATTLQIRSACLLASLGGALLVVIARKVAQYANLPREVNSSTRTITTPLTSSWWNNSVKCISFSEVAAVQVLRKVVLGSEDDYVSYELNIVLKDFERFNLIDHGDRTSIENDAKLIAEQLSCSLVKD